jgi:hypothetical protein
MAMVVGFTEVLISMEGRSEWQSAGPTADIEQKETKVTKGN